MAALCFGVAVLGWLERSSAGNLDSFYVSGEAALSAGAVVASTSTGGSVWYNPAGLSQLSGLRLDVNVSGYAVRFGARVGFDSTVANTQENRLGLLALDVVPAAVVLTRRFGNVGVGLGVFIPTENSLVLRTVLEAPTDADGIRPLTFGYDSTTKTQEYHLGPGVGWQATETLCLGLSLLANYRTEYEVTNVAATVVESGRESVVSSHTSVDSVGVGLELVLGTQWRFWENWTLGAAVRTPSLRVAQAGDRIKSGLSANSDGEIEEDIVFAESLSVGTQILNPFRFHLGLAHAFGDYLGSIEASLLLPFENEIFRSQERPTWNGRVGLRRRINNYWNVGGGLFTDRSNKATPTIFLDKQIDYYGATVAVDWHSSYGVYARNDRVLEEPRSLSFGTTVAFSYALGVGSIAGALVGPGMGGSVQLDPHFSDVVAHEFTLHIASTLSE